MSKRIPVPKILKEFVHSRQNGRCVCCPEIGHEYHHVRPVALSGENNSKNIVLLCKDCHKMLHLGNLEICLAIIEYVYFLENWELPENEEEIKILAEKIMQE